MALVSPLIYWLLCFLTIVDTVDIVTQLPHLPDCEPSYALRNDLRVSATKYTLQGMRKVSKAVGCNASDVVWSLWARRWNLSDGIAFR
ncbi:hypothetical protein ANCCAN_21831 [Ancylostoma caninum]|uniref:Secreted protein n=1 Tax=Ancylostoma caninum TaxID=29170 RepID=A0A368FQA2_ANCCA|nr:hypothetical protein ANCCAN_21831 [Ancylostoma caninum]